MLPLIHKIIFALYALVTGALVTWGFYRLYLRTMRGAAATEPRLSDLPARIGYSLWASMSQERVFRKRPVVGIIHSLVFYGFVYYLLVNVIDALEGFFHFAIHSDNPFGIAYNLLADLLSAAVIVGVIGLMIRRFATPSKRDFYFNEKTMLSERVKNGYIRRDSAIVGAFIVFHVGSRMIAQSSKMAMEGGDPWQPFASGMGELLFGGLSHAAQMNWWIFGFWGALGSILAFLIYFPYSKHFHFVGAPFNYALKRPVGSGVLPPMTGLEEAMEADEPKLGVEKLEDLEWPRLLDAYACIQCNRCQDVCPANATGKALSPAALEINKRMALNEEGLHVSPFTLKQAPFEEGASTARPLLEYAISDEAVWGCTTCGACMQVCPVQDEQMLDIVDIRRNLVMVQGEFPSQLQTAFRGMERASNPWGISRDKRMEWAEGLRVPTIDENPEPDVLYWVGCAASYDPGAQKVSRAFVQLLDKAGVNYAVLGKKEACTGDSARRAGNEFLYLQLAEENVETLNTVRPKLIVATCPHCMNMIGNEYKQIGGDYKVVHHTEYLQQLVDAGQLPTAALADDVTYHDPCYLGRHNDVYDAPRSLITRMAGQVLELERNRENSFCCGAGGAQFWKEEEEGNERISDNRFKEIQARLDAAREGKVLAVGCPFCKSMMQSTPAAAEAPDVVVKDVAELMLESVQRASGEWIDPDPESPAPESQAGSPNNSMPVATDSKQRNNPGEYDEIGVTEAEIENAQPAPMPGAKAGPAPAAKREAWNPTATPAVPKAEAEADAAPKRASWQPAAADNVPKDDVVQPERKSWNPAAASASTAKDDVQQPERKAWNPAGAEAKAQGDTQPARKSWNPSAAASALAEAEASTGEAGAGQPARKAWNPQASAGKDDVVQPQRKTWNPATAPAGAEAPEAAPAAEPKRKAWNPQASAPASAAKDDVQQPGRKVWNPQAQPAKNAQLAKDDVQVEVVKPADVTEAASTGERPKWKPKAQAQASVPVAPEAANQRAITQKTTAQQTAAQAKAEGKSAARPKWNPQANKAPAEAGASAEAAEAKGEGETGAAGRPKWNPKG